MKEKFISKTVYFINIDKDSQKKKKIRKPHAILSLFVQKYVCDISLGIDGVHRKKFITEPTKI